MLFLTKKRLRKKVSGIGYFENYVFMDIEKLKHLAETIEEIVTIEFVCIWCGCNSDESKMYCKAPDGGGHLYKRVEKITYKIKEK